MCLPRVHWLTCSSDRANGLQANIDISPSSFLPVCCVVFHLARTVLLPLLCMQISSWETSCSEWHVPVLRKNKTSQQMEEKMKKKKNSWGNHLLANFDTFTKHCQISFQIDWEGDLQVDLKVGLRRLRHDFRLVLTNYRLIGLICTRSHRLTWYQLWSRLDSQSESIAGYLVSNSDWWPTIEIIRNVKQELCWGYCWLHISCFEH